MPASSHERQAQPENRIKPNSSHNERARDSIKGKHVEVFTHHHLFQVTPVKGGAQVHQHHLIPALPQHHRNSQQP